MNSKSNSRRITGRFSELFLSEDGLLVIYDERGGRYNILGFDESECLCVKLKS